MPADIAAHADRGCDPRKRMVAVARRKASEGNFGAGSMTTRDREHLFREVQAAAPSRARRPGRLQ